MDYSNGTDQSGTIDWEWADDRRSPGQYIYAVERLDVVTAGGAPVITTQPRNVTVTEPAAATFTVVASGDLPLNYQWQRNDGGGFSDIPGAIDSSYTLDPTSTTVDNGAQFQVIVANSAGSVTSATATLTVNPGGGGGLPIEAWTAVGQNPGGSWTDSNWELRSFRILLKGTAITASGSTVQLTLRGRSAGNYTVQRVSLVRRDGATLNGDNGTNRQITFGSTWNTGVTVPAGGSVTSDPIAFDLQAGQDVFVTFWAPAGSPTLARTGGTSTATWIINGTDQSGTIDWEGLTIDITRSYIYVVERLEVIN